MSTPDELPRITLRPQELEMLRAGLGVSTLKIIVMDEDWIPFMRNAYEGMEIPVRMEGEDSYCESAILLGADHSDRSITVVI